MKELTISEIRSKIINLPGRPPAMLDKDLAQIYETDIRSVNQAANRNPNRFPDDFRFQLTEIELKVLKSQNVISNDTNKLSYAYTHQGCNMMSACLHTDIAIDRSVFIMRAFSAMEREALKDQGCSEPLEFITGEKFDMSVRRFEIALKAVRLSGITDEHEARITANRITKKTTGLDLLEFIRPGYAKSVSESSQKPHTLPPVRDNNNLTLFVNAWWEKYGDNTVDSAHLCELINESEILPHLFKENNKSQKIRLGKMLSKLNGKQVGSYIITDAGKHRNIRLWKLRPAEKPTIDS